MKCSIDSNTREIIFLDNSECFGVEFDKNTQRIEFSCPKIVGDNLDLTKCICRINYMNAKGYRDSYLIDDILVDGDNITFTWTLSSKVTSGRGNCLFIFCARQVNENGVIEKEWNTTVSKASIKRGLETNSHIEEEYSDILESILLKLNNMPNTDWNQNDQTKSDYIKNRPGGYDETEEIVLFNNYFNSSYLLSMAKDWTPRDSTNYINFDLKAPAVVAIDGVELGTFDFSKGTSFTQTVQTGPSQWTTLVIEPYHIGTKLPDDATWSDNDWYIEQRIVYNTSNGAYYRRTLVKIDNFANKKFTITQILTKKHAFDPVFTNVLCVRVDNGTKSSISGADIYKAINQGVYVYCDFYRDDVFYSRAYQTINPSNTTQPTFFLYDNPNEQVSKVWLAFYTISSQDDDYTMNRTKELYLATMAAIAYKENGANIAKIGRNGILTNAIQNTDYMSPSMGIAKPASSKPQIAVGDILSVSSLSSGVPSKWKTTKVDTTVTADSTNLVTSGAVYSAIQEAIANLNNKGE